MEIFAVILKRLETVPVALQLNNEMLSHCEPARSGPISHTDLEPECRHCQRSAARQLMHSWVLDCFTTFAMTGGVDGKLRVTCEFNST